MSFPWQMYLGAIDDIRNAKALKSWRQAHATEAYRADLASAKVDALRQDKLNLFTEKTQIAVELIEATAELQAVRNALAAIAPDHPLLVTDAAAEIRSIARRQAAKVLEHHEEEHIRLLTI
jgi:hypothetical protein